MMPIDHNISSTLSGALPTFVGSSILFIASSTLIIGCINEVYAVEKSKIQATGNEIEVLKYRGSDAFNFRRKISSFSLFLFISYAVLMISFIATQVSKLSLFDEMILFMPNLGPIKNFLVSKIADEAIYALEIILFPASAIYAVAILRGYIKIRGARILNLN